jgi:CubicO group peptidase (beta-lactamase class C family)
MGAPTVLLAVALLAPRAAVGPARARAEAEDWPRAEPSAVGLDPSAVERLIADAEASHSNALLLLKDGRVVIERYFGCPPAPVPVTSISKSVLSIVVGQLIARRAIPSLDAPLSTWFPEWSTGAKARVTVRHLLTHTSGLQHRPATGYLRDMPDLVKFVRESPLTDAPGATFAYNNEASQLLLAVVEAASGMRAEKCFQQLLFAPLDITDWVWPRDRAGNLLLEDLSLSGRDLLRVGELMSQRGVVRGRQVVPAEWVESSTRPVSKEIQSYGFLWWLIEAAGFKADGWLGQYVVVFPREHLVAVRQRRATEGGDDAENRRYGFREFAKEVRATLQAPR